VPLTLGAYTESNAAQVTCNAETAKLFGQVTGLIDRFNKVVGVVGDLDERLHALDGKRSTVSAEEDQAANLPVKGETANETAG
jgi:hypothetical protein